MPEFKRDGNMRIWSFYDLTSGALTGRTYAGSLKFLDVNTPDGHKAIQGHHDHLSYRVDLESGQLIDWQPPQPSPDHEWDSDSRRWQLSQAAADRQQRKAEALARIAALEAAQARPMRELALHPDDATARQRLSEIETQIVAAREELRNGK